MELAPSLTWRIKEKPGGPMTVEFIGEINERAAFSELKRRLKGAVVFQLGKIRRMSSSGIREWVNFIRELPQVTDLQLAECSPVVVGQLNVLTNFRGNGRVVSFFAPYRCTSCGSEEDKLVESTAALQNKQLQGMPCGKCSKTMELDDIAERYLVFLNDR